MELKEKIRLLSEQHAFDIRKLTRIGDSLGLLVPRTWVDLHCIEIDGEYYFRLKVAEGKLIFSAIDPDDIEAVTIKEKK